MPAGGVGMFENDGEDKFSFSPGCDIYICDIRQWLPIVDVPVLYENIEFL